MNLRKKLIIYRFECIYTKFLKHNNQIHQLQLTNLQSSVSKQLIFRYMSWFKVKLPNLLFN